MGELLHQLGIDWKLFLSQLVNFFILLAILRIFVYKPLFSVLKERRKKIEEGLAKAEESEIRLKEVDEISKNKLKDAEKESLNLIGKAEVKAKKVEEDLILQAQKREEEMMKKTDALIENQKAEAKKKVEEGAAEMIRSILKKTVEMVPEQIDAQLIKKAIHDSKKNEIQS